MPRSFVASVVPLALALVVASAAAEDTSFHVRSTDDGDHRSVFVQRSGNREGEGAVWIDGGHGSWGFSFGGPRSFLGVQLVDVTPELRRHFGASGDVGVLVSRVVEGTPADFAGLRAADLIVAFDGEPVSSAAELRGFVSPREAGDRVRLEVWRDGSPLDFEVTVEVREPRMRRVALDCEGSDGCPGRADFGDLCPDDESCWVEIDCDDGECDCEVNGEAVECPER